METLTLILGHRVVSMGRCHLSKSEDIVADRPGKAQSSNGLQMVAGCVRMHLDQHYPAGTELSYVVINYPTLWFLIYIGIYYIYNIYIRIYQSIYIYALQKMHNFFFLWGFLVSAPFLLEVLEVLIQPGVQVNEVGVTLKRCKQIRHIPPICEGVPLFRLEATGEAPQETEEMMPRSVWGLNLWWKTFRNW